MYADPKFIKDTNRVIEELVPIVYIHFCVMYGLKEVDATTCVQNIEAFTKTEILPVKEGIFFTTGDNQYYVDPESYDAEIQEVVA